MHLLHFNAPPLVNKLSSIHRKPLALIRFAPVPSNVLYKLELAIEACSTAPRLENPEYPPDNDCIEALEDLRAEIEHDKAVQAVRETTLACAFADDPNDPFDCEETEF